MRSNVVKKGGGGFRLWCVLCAFPFVTELPFFIYPESNCVGCGLLVPLLVSVNFNVDVVGLQMFDFTYFVKPECRICL
jgi:hypothetical protein